MIRIQHLPRLLAVVAAATLTQVAGCGSGASARSPVHGSVSYDGEPVDFGGIAFLPEDEAEGEHRPRVTGDFHDGHYDLDARRGPLPGKYRVQIYWHKKTGKKVPGEGGRQKDEIKEGIPPKYNEKSELIRDVQPGANTIDFDLPR